MPWDISRSKKRRLRAAVEKRDGIACHWCGIATEPGTQDGRQASDTRTLDHVERRREGGADDISNLVIACHDCNQNHRGPSLGAPVFLDPETKEMAR